MINKNTYSVPGVLDFDVEGVANTQGKQIAGSTEVAYFILSGGGPANVSVHDCSTVAQANYNNQKMSLDSSAGTNDTRIFTNPVAFTKGVTVVLKQGAGLGVTLSYGTVDPA